MRSTSLMSNVSLTAIWCWLNLYFLQYTKRLYTKTTRSWSDLKRRAIARSEHLGGHVVLGGDNVPPLVEIGLTGLAKTGRGEYVPPPLPPRLRQACHGTFSRFWHSLTFS